MERLFSRHRKWNIFYSRRHFKTDKCHRRPPGFVRANRVRCLIGDWLPADKPQLQQQQWECMGWREIGLHSELSFPFVCYTLTSGRSCKMVLMWCEDETRSKRCVAAIVSLSRCTLQHSIATCRWARDIKVTSTDQLIATSLLDTQVPYCPPICTCSLTQFNPFMHMRIAASTVQRRPSSSSYWQPWPINIISHSKIFCRVIKRSVKSIGPDCRDQWMRILATENSTACRVVGDKRRNLISG